MSKKNLFITIWNIVLSIGSLIIFSGCSYTQKLPILTRSQALQDIKYAVENLKAIHPEPFTHISEENFNKKYEQIQKGINQTITRKELSLLIAELFATINDSHTMLSYYAQYPCFWDNIDINKYFPFELRYYDIDDSMRICDWDKVIQTKKIRKGDRLIAINGQTIDSLKTNTLNIFQPKWKCKKTGNSKGSCLVSSGLSMDRNIPLTWN